MSSARKSGGGEGGEMDIDLGKAKVINLESEQDGAASGSAVGPTMKKLEHSFRDLILEGDGTKRMELLSKLEASRTQAAEEERRARRAAWTEETRKVNLERQLFQDSRTTDVFPELVWEQIMSKVDDPKENSRLARMAQLWREVSKKGRTTFLFNEVFAMLHAKGYLPRNDILLLRGLSREWRKSTDNWLQNFAEYPMRNYLQLRNLRPFIEHDKVPLIIPMNWRRREAMSVLLGSHDFPPDGNPFFSRTLDLGSIEADPAYWMATEHILAMWGREVWTVKFQFLTPNDLEYCVDAYEQLVILLRLLPNLRHLVLLFPDLLDLEGEGEAEFYRLTLLRKCMLENPLPEMPHLKSIKASKVPSLMQKLMLEKFGATLDTFIADQVDGDGDVFENAQLPNLRVMMNLLPPQVSQVTMNWPSIKEINLRYDNAVAADIPNIFCNLGDVGGTLRKLNLILENEFGSGKLDNAVVKMLTLELPNLEEFALSMSLGQGNMRTIDFILPMKKLKILSLTYVKLIPFGRAARKPKTKSKSREPGPGSSRQTEEASKGEIINYWEYMSRLYQSNIWLLFPDLRKVTIVTLVVQALPEDHPPPMGGVVNRDNWKVKVYSREGFKEYSVGHGH